MNLKKCSKLCIHHDVSCPNEDCRYWINFSEDLNCTFIAIKKHGAMTLREVARRTGVSFVRIKSSNVYINWFICAKTRTSNESYKKSFTHNN